MWKYLAFFLLIVLGTNGWSDAESDITATEESRTTIYLNGTTVTPEISANTTVTPDASANTTVPTETTEKPTVTPETTEKPTVAPTVPTTPLPKAEIGKWSVIDKVTNKTCIKVEMAVQLKIEKDSIHHLHNLSPNATATKASSCNTSEGFQILEIEDKDGDDDYKLSLTFVHKDKKVYVQNISVSFSIGGVSDLAITSGNFFSSGDDKSYKCVTKNDLSFDNVTLSMSSVQVQAFKDSDNFVYAEECDQDDTVSDIVPIAVGCALGALVIVVLIAYLVGRRRSRQKGYQSV